MIYHILNGDGLAGNFNLDGEIIVCRECLIDGNIKAKNLNELWKVRSEFVRNNYGADDYFEKVKNEFDKFNNLNPTDEVNLWFGNEAFCQVNMWFVLSLLEENNPNVYRVFPDSNCWDCSYKNLEDCFEKRQKMSSDEVSFGKKLWNQYDSGSLTDEINFPSNFPKLNEVCQAIVERESKPKEILREITKNGETDFSKIFIQFKEKAGIYGFGDTQIKRILAEI